MSGGHFNYSQFRFYDIKDQIEDIINDNDSELVDKWGDKIGFGYSKETLVEFRKAIEYLKLAGVYVHCIDYLISGDYSEDSFHEALKEKLQKME